MSGKHYKDWLPAGHKELYLMAVTMIANLSAELLARLGLSSSETDPPSVGELRIAAGWYMQVFMPSYQAYVALYALFIDPAKRTPYIAQQFYTAEAAFVANLRQFYMGYVRNNLDATDADRVALGFPILKKTHTKAPAPHDVPEVDIAHPAIGIIAIYVHALMKRGKPDSTIHGFEVRSAISDSPIANGEWHKLTRSDFSTVSPLIISDYSSFIGKTLYFAVRWENTTGGKGPWTQVFSVVIS
ncbi:MAG: hypothetical protein LBC81_06290 [Tannerellaceae bacterium]|jgi:hypothetical protein|nr:hypothetical protein [Tannerellaceae bacterium]